MARKRWDRMKDERKVIARERMEILLREAEAAYLRGDHAHADRYAQLARRISMRYKVPLPPGAKLLFCKECGTFVGGAGSRVRINATGVARTCLKCGAVWRRPLAPRIIKERKGEPGRRGGGGANVKSRDGKGGK